MVLPPHTRQCNTTSNPFGHAAIRYRLKGCGNNSDGFIVKTERMNIAVDDGAPQMLEFLQVRGAAFPHTAVRELAMSSRVADALAPVDAAGVNTPVALMTCASPKLHVAALSRLIALAQVHRRSSAAPGPVSASCLHRGAYSWRPSSRIPRSGWPRASLSPHLECFSRRHSRGVGRIPAREAAGWRRACSNNRIRYRSLQAKPTIANQRLLLHSWRALP